MKIIGEVNLRMVDSAGGDDDTAVLVVTTAGNIVVQTDGSVLLPDGRVFYPHAEVAVPIERYNELMARSARLEGLEK